MEEENERTAKIDLRNINGYLYLYKQTKPNQIKHDIITNVIGEVERLQSLPSSFIECQDRLGTTGR